MPYFDRQTGLLDRAVFSSAEIYREEQGQIFDRCWLFVGPENWLLESGDFHATSIGETRVLVWRDAGDLRVFVNQCVGSTEVLTTEVRGRNNTFICPCHGWVYHPDGSIANRPGWRAGEVPRVECYKGLVFASRALSGPTLRGYLGDFAWYLDTLIDRRAGGVEIYGEDSLRWLIDTNWKVPAEAFAGDIYRSRTVHAATNEALHYRVPSATEDGLQVSAGAGAIALLTQPHVDSSSQEIAKYRRGVLPEAAARLGEERAQSLTPLTCTLFPNLSFDARTHSLHVWQPRGPSRTEIQTYCFVDRDAPRAVKEEMRKVCSLNFGPLGLQAQDDVVPWTSLARPARYTALQDIPLNLQMGLGRQLKRNLPGQVSELFSEMNQRAFYAWWSDKLADSTQVPAPAETVRIAATAEQDIGLRQDMETN